MINHLGFCIVSAVAFFALIAQVTSNALHNESCQTPTEEQGMCVQLEQCSFLNEMLDKMHLLFESIQYLRRSQCGSANGKVLVCCPSHDNETQDPQIKTKRLLPEPGTCGKMISHRFWDNNQTQADHYPWMAAMEYKDADVQHTAVLINEQYVLTAAHHATSSYKNGSPIRVRLGAVDFPKHGPNVTIDVEKVVIHEGFNASTTHSAHDIALVRLASPVTYSNFIQSLCLPVASNLKVKSFEGEVMNLVERRRTEDSVSFNTISKSTAPVMPLNVCQKLFSESEENVLLQDAQMCVDAAGHGAIERTLIGMDTTDEDTTDEAMEYYYIAGITSFGHTSKPGLDVYTKIIDHIDWIQKNLEP